MAQPARKNPVGVPFKKGQSGNPGGRPKGVAARARDLVGNDPTRLLEVLLAVAEDETEKASDRVRATQELLDRGWGKSPSYAPVEEGDPLELDAVDRAIHNLMDDLAAKRKAKAARRPTNGRVARNGKA